MRPLVLMRYTVLVLIRYTESWSWSLGVLNRYTESLGLMYEACIHTKKLRKQLFMQTDSADSDFSIL